MVNRVGKSNYNYGEDGFTTHTATLMEDLLTLQDSSAESGMRQ